MTEYGMLLTDLDTELFIEIFDELKRAKTKKVSSYHSPSSYDPKILSEDVNPHTLTISGAFINDVIAQGRKLDYLTQIEDDVLFVYPNRDLMAYLLLSKGGVGGDKDSIVDDLFSVNAKTKGQLLGQMRMATDSRCTTGGEEITDTDAMRDKATFLTIPGLAVVDWQANPATGTATNPQRINDNATGSLVTFDAVNEYCEVEFDESFYINKFRYFGWGVHSEDGTYKLQYFDSDTQAWVDWETGITTRLATWSNWNDLDLIHTTKVRIIATALDSAFSKNSPGEFELKYEGEIPRGKDIYFKQTQNGYMLSEGDYEMITRMKQSTDASDNIAKMEVLNNDDTDEWVNIYTPGAVNILCLKEYADKLYVGTSDGKIYETEDGDNFLLAYDTGQAEVHCLEEHEDCLYAGTGNSGKIFKYDEAAWTEEYDTGETDVFALKTFYSGLYAGTGANGKIFRLKSGTWAEYLDTAETSVFSLENHNTVLYAGTGANGKIYILDYGVYISISAEYTPPGSYPSGLTHDGTNIWSCDYSTAKIYKHNADMTVNTEYTPSGVVAGYKPYGLAWDGTNIWSCDYVNNKIYKHDVTDPNLAVLNTYTGLGSIPTGLTWDGTNIWSCDKGANKIYKHKVDMTLDTSYDSPNSYPSGLIWDGFKIWSCDYATAKIYRHNTDMTVDFSYYPEKRYRGLAFDGSYIWSCRYDALYKKIQKHQPIYEVHDAADNHIYTLKSSGGNLYAGGDTGDIYKGEKKSWTTDYTTGETEIRGIFDLGGKAYVGTGINGKLFARNGSWALSEDLDDICIYAGETFQNKYFIGTGAEGNIHTYRNGIIASALKSLEDDMYKTYTLPFTIRSFDINDEIRFKITKEDVSGNVTIDFLGYAAT